MRRCTAVIIWILYPSGTTRKQKLHQSPGDKSLYFFLSRLRSVSLQSSCSLNMTVCAYEGLPPQTASDSFCGSTADYPVEKGLVQTD